MSLPGAMPSRRTPSTSTSKGRGRVPVVTVKPVPCSPTMPVRVCTAGQAIGADGLSIDAAATAGGDTAVAARSTPSAPDTATPAHDRRVNREDRELTVITLLLNEVDNPSMKLALLPAVARIIETRVYRARPDRVGPTSAGYLAVTSRGLAPAPELTVLHLPPTRLREERRGGRGWRWRGTSGAAGWTTSRPASQKRAARRRTPAELEDNHYRPTRPDYRRRVSSVASTRPGARRSAWPTSSWPASGSTS